MINTYYLLISGEKAGPYTQYEIMNMDLNADTMVLSPLAEDWQEMSDLDEFAFYFEDRGIYIPTKANLASFWWRLLAYLIDYVIVVVMVTVLAVVYGLILNFMGIPFEPDAPDTDLLLRFGIIIFMIIYHAVCESSSLQGGIGKVACKLKVVDRNGKRLTFSNALGRNAAKLLSSLVIGIGYLRILWDDHRQGWHDELAKAYVVRP